MFRHILFPHDGSDLSRSAAADCVSLAKEMGASITALQVIRHCDLLLEEGGPAELVESLEERIDSLTQGDARREMAQLKELAEANGVYCETVVTIGGSPHKAIVDQARQKRCDLIVMASHARSAIDALVHGSSTTGVLRHCNIPVLVLRPNGRA